MIRCVPLKQAKNLLKQDIGKIFVQFESTCKTNQQTTQPNFLKHDDSSSEFAYLKSFCHVWGVVKGLFRVYIKL